MTPIVFEFPGKLVSVLNAREHWSRKARRVKHERQAAWAECVRATRNIVPPFPLLVTVTRIAPKALDKHDNLPASAKGVIDGIADFLRIKDDDSRVTFTVAQQAIGRRKYSVRVEIAPREEGAPA